MSPLPLRPPPLVAALLLGTCLSCESGAPPEPKPRIVKEPPSARTAAAKPTPKPAATATATATPPRKPPQRKVSARPAASVPISPDDPLKGKFDLDAALAGLPAGDRLVATLKTDKGELGCELWPDKAPITVANFVGLARGLRPWKTPAGEWVKKPLYDGTVFHRIIRGFMIQGGDPKGNGSGEPGYVIPDEIWDNAHHDRRGLLCMANRGPNTNGAQFFIMDGAAPHLDNGYTIFGHCGPEKVIEALAGSDVRGDRAVSPPKILSVKVTREKGK